jgi:hypothetical protein
VLLGYLQGQYGRPNRQLHTRPALGPKPTKNMAVKPALAGEKIDPSKRRPLAGIAYTRVPAIPLADFLLGVEIASFRPPFGNTTFSQIW